MVILNRCPKSGANWRGRRFCHRLDCHSMDVMSTGCAHIWRRCRFYVALSLQYHVKRYLCVSGKQILFAIKVMREPLSEITLGRDKK